MFLTQHACECFARPNIGGCKDKKRNLAQVSTKYTFIIFHTNKNLEVFTSCNSIITSRMLILSMKRTKMPSLLYHITTIVAVITITASPLFITLFTKKKRRKKELVLEKKNVLKVKLVLESCFKTYVSKSSFTKVLYMFYEILFWKARSKTYV